MRTKGSCLCGKVRFEIEGAFESFFLCHCEYCRKDTGSAHAANLFSTTARVNWLSGQDGIKTYNLPATRHTKSFCSKCGSALPYTQEDGEWIAVPAGSLDDKVPIKPNAHIFTASKADWDQDLENVPQIEKFPV